MSTFSTAFILRNTVRAALAGALSFVLLGLTPSAAMAAVNACSNAEVTSPEDFCHANITNLANGLAQYALIAALVGICISASLWALGSKGQNPGQELTGKRGLIVCCAAAFCVGGVVPFMNRLQGYARDIDNSPPPAVQSPAPQFGGGPTAGGLNGGPQ